MFVTLVHIRVKPEHADAFVEATRRNHEASTREPGNRRFDVIRSVDEPDRFLLTRPMSTSPRRRRTRRPSTTGSGARSQSR